MNHHACPLPPIGVVRSPFREAAGTPIQPVRAVGCRGTVEIDPELVDGLADLAGFDRIWLICWGHRTCDPSLRVVPYRDTVPRGVFATRAPARPNPIILSPIRLLGVTGATLHLDEVDLLDGTPVLDLKPYVAEYDAHPSAARGWLDASSVRPTVQADGRFEIR